jgi:hypothetical protein
MGSAHPQRTCPAFVRGQEDLLEPLLFLSVLAAERLRDALQDHVAHFALSSLSGLQRHLHSALHDLGSRLLTQHSKAVRGRGDGTEM